MVLDNVVMCANVIVLLTAQSSVWGESFGSISLLIGRRYVTDMHRGLVGPFPIAAPTTVSHFAHSLCKPVEPDDETSITLREAAKATVPPVNAPKNFTPLD